MIRAAASLALLLPLVACSPAPTPTTPDPSAAPSATPSTTIAPAPTSTPDQLERADACAKAAVAVNPNAPALDQMRTVVTGCLPVYSEKGCRDALEAAIADGTPPEQRIVVMSKGCGDAYCPKITDEPRPKFCTLPDSTEPSERAKTFVELRNRIFLLELGEEGRARVDAAFKKAKEAQDRAKN